MKKIALLMLCALLMLSFTACKEEKEAAETENAVVEQEKEKFTEYEKLTDRFMEYCESGNVEGIYSLYYDNMLEKMYDGMSDKLTKEQFDALLKEEMATIYSFEEFEYGCPEMPAMSSPLSYVNQLLYNTGEESLKLTDAQVSNCVDLRVYKEGSAYPSDHMMACIEGYWYFVV
jgi:hypothetical protein